MPNAASGAAFNPNMNTALRGAGSIGRFGSPVPGNTGPGGTIGASIGSVGPSSNSMLGPTMPKMLPNGPGTTPGTIPPMQPGGVGPSEGGLEQLLKIFMNLQSHGQMPNTGPRNV